MGSVLDQIQAARQAAETPSIASQIAGQMPDVDQNTGLEVVMGGLANNGRVLRQRSGELAFVDANYSTTDQAQIQAILDGSTASEQATQSQYQGIIDQAPVGARAAKFLQGTPFVGEYYDEAMGSVFGEGSQRAVRASQAAMQAVNPVESAALQLGGAAAGTMAAVGAAPALIAAPTVMAARIPGVPIATSVLGRGAAGLGLGAAAGGIEGAVSGYGAGNDGDRGQSAQNRGAMGAAFGGALGAAAPTAGAAFRGVLNYVRSRPIQVAAKELGVSEDAINMLRTNVDLGNVAEDITAPGSMLADIGPTATGQLDAALNTGGKAGVVAAQRTAERVQGAGLAITSTLDDVLGSPVGRAATGANIRAGARDATGEAYDAAYSTAIDYAGGAGAQIDDVIGRIPQERLTDAVRRANEMMQWRGIDTPQIDLAEGSANLNIAQLDYLKRAFDSIRRDGIDPVTLKMTDEARVAGDMARSVRDAAAAASPEYRNALSLASDTLGMESAVDTGYTLLRPGVTREVVADAISSMSNAERVAAGQGVRDYIDDQLANVARTMTDPDTAVREVQKLMRSLSTRSSREKLAGLVGEEQAARIFDQLDTASIAFNIRAQTVANSRTAARTATLDQAQEIASSGIIRRLKSGEVVMTAREITQALTGETAEAVTARRQGLLAEVADILTRSEDNDAVRALLSLRNVDITEPLGQSRAAFLGSTIANILALEEQQRQTRAATGR